ncbi:lipid A deacylase LpxR family protein [Flavisolibacter sp. BT320]|nr:lipid A deacylase LpxR family protein [Flavisolibacter longurius]
MYRKPFSQQPSSFILVLSFCLLAQFVQPLQAQKTNVFSHQLSVLTENDRYVFKGKDGYYTNGLLLRYTKAAPQAEKGSKRLHHFSLGQKIFMPYSRRVYVVNEIDRPISGYLFLQYNRSHFKTPQTLWLWGVSADAIGDASGARQVQNTFHNWIGVNSNYWGWVWDYQVKSQLGLNIHGQFAKGLITGTAAAKTQLVPITKATLGTSFTNISQGLAIQFGQLATQDQSAFWDAAPGTAPGQKMEWAFYYQPEVMYQAYNATIQGGLFRENKGPITADPEPLVFTHQVGFFLSGGRYQARLAANFQGKEAKSQHFSHSYGSVQVAYRFR